MTIPVSRNTQGYSARALVRIAIGGFSSLEAPPLFGGNQHDGAGMSLIIVDPALSDPGFPARLGAQFELLPEVCGVYLPGAAKAVARVR